MVNRNSYYRIDAIQKNFSYLIILIPNIIFTAWIISNNSLPGSDSANFLDLSLQKFHIIKNSNNILSIYQALYLYRDWKPVSYSNFIIPFFFISDNLIISIKIFQIILFSFLVFIIYQSLHLLIDKLYASLICNLIVLNPYFFNLATEFYADFPSIVLTYLSAFLFIRSIYEKKSIFIWISAIVLAISITLRPVETLFFTVSIFLLYFIFHYRLFISELIYFRKQISFFILSIICNLSTLAFIYYLYLHANILTVNLIFFISLFLLFIQIFVLKKIFNISSVFISLYVYLTLSFSIAFVWFAPFINQTWNWIYYTSIGNRIFQSDQSFKEKSVVEVLNSIFNQFYNTKILMASFFILLICLIYIYYIKLFYFKYILIFFISILIYFLFFIFIYFYSGTADPRRVALLILIYTLFFYITLSLIFPRKFFLVFINLIFILNLLNFLPIVNKSYTFNLNFLFSNSIKKPYIFQDPNFKTYTLLNNYSFENGSKIAWLSSNAVTIGDSKYILDPAIIRMLYVKNKVDLLFWYTVSSNLEGYISNLKSEGYHYIIVDSSLPNNEPPASNFFMNSNYHIIKSLLNTDLNKFGIVKFDELQISEVNLILYRINY